LSYRPCGITRVKHFPGKNGWYDKLRKLSSERCDNRSLLYG